MTPELKAALQLQFVELRGSLDALAEQIENRNPGTREIDLGVSLALFDLRLRAVEKSTAYLLAATKAILDSAEVSRD